MCKLHTAPLVPGWSEKFLSARPCLLMKVSLSFRRRMQLRSLRSLLFAVGIILPAFTHAAPPPDPSVDQIVANALGKSEADEKNLTRYAYHQKVTFEKLDAAGKADATSNLEMEVTPGAPSEFTVVGQNGKVTDEQQKQAKLSQKFKMTFSLRKMAPRFDVRLDGKETQNGRSVYRLAFSPKPDQPFENRVEKISNHFVGLMWIDATDFSLLKVTAHLDDPVDMAWILASMESLDFSYEACPIAGGVAPCRFVIQYRLGFPMVKVRQRNEITMSNYRVRAS
jgi:hypothetical protein